MKPTVNPHVWRKFKQAERNFLRLAGIAQFCVTRERWWPKLTGGRRRLRERKWARAMLKEARRMVSAGG